MKDYIIKINKNITRVINIKKANTVYEFCDSSKDIIDNLNKGNEYILKLLKDKYKNINSEIIEKDYFDFINELNNLNININNIEDIIICLEDNIINNANIEIINKCPFKCKHCYIDNQKIEINLEKYKLIIDELVEINCKEILLTGGEPMLHQHFIEMYLYAKKKGMIVSINSNLFLLNDNILSILSKYKPNVIEVSIYGNDDDSYKKFTGASHAFSIVDNNINKLLDNDININLKSIIAKSNCENIIKIKEYAHNKNLPFRYDYIIFPNLNKTEENRERCSPSEIIKIIKSDEETKLYFKEKLKKLKIDNNNEKIFQCGICSGRAFISSNLDIRPCLVVPFKVNLVDYNIKDAYKIITSTPSDLIMSSNNKCRNCNKKSICRYCPGKFYMETGNFEIVPNFLENKEKHDNEANKNRWINMIKNTDNYNVITFEENNEVLGFLNYSIIEDEMWISEVQIKEEHKNKKILKNLLKEFILIDELKKYEYIIIHINDNNEISKKVFKHIGFYDVGNTLYKIDKNILIDYLNK